MSRKTKQHASVEETTAPMRVQEAPPVVPTLPSGLQSTSDTQFTPAGLIARVQAGLPYSELEALRELVGLPMERLAPRLGISKATLHRRRVSGKLDSGESDRVLRFARLFAKAAEVCESRESARRWLNTPQVGLGGASPIEYAETEIGAREVEDLLGRIEFGVYS